MYCETSCKEGRNIEMAFDMLTKDIIDKQNNKDIYDNKNIKFFEGKEKKREKEIACC